ncbi:MAG TPA: efflux RND transporter permease subunit [Methylomirabilota bacterium]|nr:efflux RND transporter permease subunit [Methylomirabilota bacterium]
MRTETGITMLERIIYAFIDAKLTPLLLLTTLLLGVFAVLGLPREEEPQIIVPMMDVFLAMPGSSSNEVEERISIPLEKYLAKIPGVEYVYTTSSPGLSVATVVFYVGENEQDAVVKLYSELYAHLDLAPPGASPPVIKTREIDDVPIVALTLWSRRYDHYTLRRIAAQLDDALREIPGVAETTLIGGQRRVVQVTPDPDRMAAFHLDPTLLLATLQGANRELFVGGMSQANTEYRVIVGDFFRTTEEVEQLVVGVYDGRPIHLRDVATVEDRAEEANNYVFFAHGPAATSPTERTGQPSPAVILSVAKQKGANAVTVAEQVLRKLAAVRGALLPADVQVTVTRNYGETAQEKFDELLEHLLIAVAAVTGLIGLFLHWRAAFVVFIAVPATLALTLFIYYFFGYTLNRMTFFGLILSIGILVDDPIVGVENIVRHHHLTDNHGKSPLAITAAAMTEIGNPLILATLAVICAFLPLTAVSGLAGSYARPMPVGAASAMVFSMAISFVITPWAAYRFLRHDAYLVAQRDGTSREEGWTVRVYRYTMTALLTAPWKRAGFLGGVMILLVGAAALLWAKVVVFKLLPFDNKAEFKVMIDLPEGATLEKTAQVTQEIGAYLGALPEVVNYQLCIGAASPPDFNGLVRRYFLRQAPHLADIHVNLLPKGRRSIQLHDFVKRIRPDIHAIAARHGAQVTLAEGPPGPPVRQTLVAEVYGPDYNAQIAAAEQIRSLFYDTPGIVDIDWSVEAPQPTHRFVVDKEKAALHGIPTERVVQALQLAVGGATAGMFHLPEEKEPVPLLLQLPRADRSSVAGLTHLRLVSAAGALTPLTELVRIEDTTEPPFIYRKNLRRVVYVTGDTAGAIDSPLYTIFQLNNSLDHLTTATGAPVQHWMLQRPFVPDQIAVKWDGEWQVTYEFLHNVLFAFVAVLVLIYILLVGWFQSFKTPLIILTPVPLSLIGILPAHALAGIFFSGASVIGFIAGAGIVVRNSIILVDFAELRRKQGLPLLEAVVDAGAVRFRPMLLTAASVVVGTAVMLYDPILQGLALSLMAGEVASTFLSRLAVPILYFLSEQRTETAKQYSKQPAADFVIDASTASLTETMSPDV